MGGRAGRADRFAGRTAGVIVLRPLLAYAETCGVDRARLLADLGLDEEALTDPDARIDDALHDRAWHEAATRSKDPVFGVHLAQHARIGAYDVLDYALRFSATIGDGLQRMVTFQRLLCDSLSFNVESDARTTRVRRLGECHGAQHAEFAFAFLVSRARELAGPDLPPPLEVRFRHAQPSDIAALAAFFRCPLIFRSPTSELICDATELMRPRPVPEPGPGLAEVLDRQMRDLLARLPAGTSVMDRVHHAVASTIREQRRPSLDATAKAMKASPRTVQRWLAEHGATHREVVDGVRRDAAVHFLDEQRLSILEIAFLLGFTDVGSFQRTFKRWTGRTPSSERARRPERPSAHRVSPHAQRTPG